MLDLHVVVADDQGLVRGAVLGGLLLGGTDDLSPGRLGLTVCDGVVVDTRMDLEPEG